jgi:hypothetical protein
MLHERHINHVPFWEVDDFMAACLTRTALPDYLSSLDGMCRVGVGSNLYNVFCEMSLSELRGFWQFRLIVTSWARSM